MFNFNIPGILMLFGGALLSNILITLGASTKVGVTIGLGVMMAADVAYRWGRSPETGWRKWVAVNGGGFVALGPVWALGLLLVVLVQLELLPAE
ncbi:MAG: hypothetical protein OT477_12905 [Chloroflexi bacterium]|nr:hypothetical protein [Chloroflexota bacterium]